MRIFYGWIIIPVVMLGMVLIYGIRHSFAVFFSSILNEFGWARADISLMLSLNVLVYGFCAPVAGLLAERTKAKNVMIIGVIALGGATACCSAANELWHFYVLFGVVMPIATGFCGWPIFGPALMNWFISKRGLVLGLGQVGGGLSFAYGILVEWSILQFGWRHSFVVLGGVLMVLLVPLSALYFQYRPQDIGLQAYGLRERQGVSIHHEKAISRIDIGKRSCSLREALLSRQALLLMVSYALFWGISGYLVIAHQVRFIEDTGFSRMFAVSIAALLGMSIALGQLSGFVSDWLGREKTTTLASILCIVALACLVCVRNPSQSYLLYAYGICFGYGLGLFTPAVLAGAADIFAGQHYGAVAGFLLTGMGVGGLIGPYLGGYLFDVTGSYNPAFLTCILCVACSCCCVWVAGPRKGPLQHAELSRKSAEE